jgi:hypothetical protein
MSTPEPASGPTSDRQPETPTAIERHRAADAAEAMADALRANDWAEWSRAFRDFQSHMEAARNAGAVIDAVPEPVEVREQPNTSGAIAGAAERIHAEHPMRGGPDDA